MLRLAVASALSLSLLGCGATAGQFGAEEFGWFSGSGRAYVGHGPFALRWRQRLTPEYDGAYVPVERAVAALDPTRDRLYIGSTGGHLYALTAAGRRMYRYDAGGAVEAEPALDAARDELYIGTEQGAVHRIRASDGAFQWQSNVGGPIRKPPVLLDDAVYAVTDTDEVTALAREDGEVLWTYKREAPEGFTITEHAGLTLSNNRLFTAFTDGVIVALDPSDGRVMWERDTSVDVDTNDGERPSFVDVDTTPVVVATTVYAASFSAGVYALSASNGSVLWHDSGRTGVVGIAADEERLYLASADSGLSCLALEDHRHIWARALTRGAPTRPIVTSDAVLIGESTGSFLALSTRDGREIGRFDASYGFSAPASVSHGFGFVLSNGGSLYAFGVL